MATAAGCPNTRLEQAAVTKALRSRNSFTRQARDHAGPANGWLRSHEQQRPPGSVIGFAAEPVDGGIQRPSARRPARSAALTRCRAGQRGEDDFGA